MHKSTTIQPLQFKKPTGFKIPQMRNLASKLKRKFAHNPNHQPKVNGGIREPPPPKPLASRTSEATKTSQSNDAEEDIGEQF